MEKEDLKLGPDGIFGRFNHPFLGSFLTAWIFFNWDILYLLWGGTKEPIDTIKMVKDSYFVNSNICHTFVFPFFSMLGYVFGGPFLTSFHGWYKNLLDVKRRFFEAKSDLQEPITKHAYLILEHEKTVLNENLTNTRVALHGLSTDKRIFSIQGIGTLPIEEIIKNYRDLYSENQKQTSEIALLKSKLQDYENIKVVESGT